MDVNPSCSDKGVLQPTVCHVDALATGIEDAWTGCLSEKAFKNVHRRMKIVSQLIVKDEGGNKLVEEHRGKLFRDATTIDLTSMDDEDHIELNLTEMHINISIAIGVILVTKSSFAWFSSNFIKNVRVFRVPLEHVCVESYRVS